MNAAAHNGVRLSTGGHWLSSLGRNAMLPMATLLLVLFMLVPVPVLMLDVGFILNILISLAVLMVALNVAKPLDFSSFPSVLLFATLFRLALNVASTRVVLVDGHTGTAAAGQVIEAFGHILIGGDYVVGLFVFAILMIINLVVITKGAGRVSEVSARFILDALPGKQMAIDADLNAGLSTPEESKSRRQEVATEADFYGSMDGASKFVKGDAIAGVLILFVNIIGGLLLGTMRHGMSLSDAAFNYVILAIGDALVAQVPALLLSIAAATIVTRVSSPLDLPQQISSQFRSSRAWIPVAAILAVLGLMPGMPYLIILPAAAMCGFLAWRLSRSQSATLTPDGQSENASQLPVVEWHDVAEDAVISLDLGFALIGLVDERNGAPLMSRITGLRRQISRELGFVVPLVRVRDELSLSPNSYRIQIGGVVVGEDEIWPGELLALDPGHAIAPIEGRPAKDPAFGLDAWWIAPAGRDEAAANGYTVVDAGTVIATHMSQLLHAGCVDLFGIDEAQGLIDTLKDTSPQLVANLSPSPLPLANLAALCRSLLNEKVPLRDFRRIAHAMVDAARVESDPARLVEAVRLRIGSMIVQTIVGVNDSLPVITLSQPMEALVQQAARAGKDATHAIEPELAQQIVAAVGQVLRPLTADNRRIALATAPLARPVLARLLNPHFPDLAVLSFMEIPETKAVDILVIVGEAEPPGNVGEADPPRLAISSPADEDDELALAL